MHKILENNGKAIAAFLLAVATSMSCMLGASAAAQIYTIEAPNGVGDVVALTNVLANMPTVTDNTYNNSRIWLEPGLYDLRGIHMTSESHLDVKHSRNLMIAGLGNGPEDTILLGGGEAENHRVMYVSGGGNYWTTTISNITVTGGWSNKTGGGVMAGNSSVLYDTCIFSNNVSLASALDNSTHYSGGGACYLGRARNCLFADNMAAGAGGAISTKCRDGANQTFTAASIIDCVFTNNHSTGDCYTITYQGNVHCGGGGAVCISSRGIVSGTKFLGNTASSRGGALCVRGGSSSVYGCTFVENVSKNNKGGALFGWAAVTNCVFVGNKSHDGGGAMFAPTSNQSGEVVDCCFWDNAVTGWGHGGGIRSADDASHIRVSMCDFSRNTASYGSAAYYCDLVDCVVTNHTSVQYLLFECNLMRCMLAGNSHINNGVADYAQSGMAGVYSSVNCLIMSNTVNGTGHIACNKMNFNCTYVGNYCSNGNYGDIIRNCPSVNCLYSRNKIGNSYRDIRTTYLGGGTVSVALTNCVFTAADIEVDHDGLKDCKKVADVRFVDAANGDYTPKTRSAAYDAGCQDPWILSLVGATDLAGNDRVFGGRIDIGAYESQVRKPGATLIFR